MILSVINFTCEKNILHVFHTWQNSRDNRFSIQAIPRTALLHGLLLVTSQGHCLDVDKVGEINIPTITKTTETLQTR